MLLCRSSTPNFPHWCTEFLLKDASRNRPLRRIRWYVHLQYRMLFLHQNHGTKRLGVRPYPVLLGRKLHLKEVAFWCLDLLFCSCTTRLYEPSYQEVFLWKGVSPLFWSLFPVAHWGEDRGFLDGLKNILLLSGRTSPSRILYLLRRGFLKILRQTERIVQNLPLGSY